MHRDSHVFSTARGTARRLAVLAAVSLLAAPLLWCQEETDLRPDRAVDLYDAGNYAEARQILEQLDAEGDLGGPLLYRLFFCRRVGGDKAGEREALERAIATLEREVASAKELETPFYLANAYQNAGRPSDSRDAAARATARVESGEIPAPATAMDMFRLGKLYADQRREEPAIEWYRKSIEAFGKQPGSFPANVAWARRYIAEAAWARADFATAAAEYAGLVAAGAPSMQDLDRLASARARLGQWDGAVEAWQKAEALDPAQANRPRYCWRLAAMAGRLGALPDPSPSGQPWSALSREDLEKLMAEQAEAVKTAVEAAAAGSADRAVLESRIAAAKPVFVRAGIEYSVRGYPIRETAFLGGYAPLIFHESRWQLPPAP